MQEKIEFLKKLFAVINEAAQLGGRSGEDITLVAISKKRPAEDIRAYRMAGITNFGENYVQEFIAKYEELKDIGIRWHFTGTLQKNKVKYIIDKVWMIQTVDSEGLAQEIQRQAEKKEIRKIKVLLQVNTGNEDQKGGINPENLPDFFSLISNLDRLDVRGLMTIPPFLEPEAVRPYFRMLRELRQKLISEKGLDHQLFSELSMGMSGDFDVAIEEGATIIRPGTILFGERT